MRHICIFIMKKDKAGKAKGLKFHVDTFSFGHRNLAALDDLDILGRSVTRLLLHILDKTDDVHALEDFSEDNVASIKPTMNQISSLHLQSKKVAKLQGDKVWESQS